jgi:hypothetical protein
MFTLDVSVNRRNNKWFVHDPNDAPVGFIIRFIASVCGLGFMSYECDVMHPYFFKQGDTVTKEGYFDVC